MKRVFAIFLILALAFSYTACNKPDPEPTPEPDPYPNGVIATLDIRKSILHDEQGKAIEGTEYAKVHSHRGSVDYSTMEWQDYQYFNIVIIPDTYEGVPVTKIEEEAFKDTTNHFWYVNMPDSIEEIGSYAFYSCYELETVNLPKHGVTLPKNLKHIGAWAFAGCNFAGYDLVLPDQLETIDAYAFRGCGLNSFTLPESIQSIGMGAFSYNAFKTVTINFETIPKKMFMGCKLLEHVTFGDDVRVIKEDAFLYCRNINTITFSKSIETIEPGTFDFRTEQLENLVINYQGTEEEWNAIDFPSTSWKEWVESLATINFNYNA